MNRVVLPQMYSPEMGLAVVQAMQDLVTRQLMGCQTEQEKLETTEVLAKVIDFKNVFSATYDLAPSRRLELQASLPR